MFVKVPGADVALFASQRGQFLLVRGGDGRLKRFDDALLLGRRLEERRCAASEWRSLRALEVLACDSSIALQRDTDMDGRSSLNSSAYGSTILSVNHGSLRPKVSFKCRPPRPRACSQLRWTCQKQPRQAHLASESASTPKLDELSSTRFPSLQSRRLRRGCRPCLDTCS